MSVSAVLDDDNLLGIILNLMDDPPTLRAATAVCTRWHELVAPVKMRVLRKFAAEAVASDETTRKMHKFCDFLMRKRRCESKFDFFRGSGFSDDAVLEGAKQIVANIEGGAIPVVLEGGGDERMAQVVAAFVHLNHHDLGPWIVVCSSDSLPLWSDAFQRHAPTLTVMMNEGGPKARHANLKLPFGVAITSYAIAIKDMKQLGRIAWKGVVWDDGVRELRRGWCEGSNTFMLFEKLIFSRGLHAGGLHQIMLSPSRTADLCSVAWLANTYIMSQYPAFGHPNGQPSGPFQLGYAAEVVEKYLRPLSLGRAQSLEVAEEMWLSTLQSILDKISRPLV